MGLTKTKQRRLHVEKEARRQVSAETELQRRQAKKITFWQKELERRGRTIRRDSSQERTLCWGLYYDEVAEARQLGIEETLRSMCWEAAGKFANPAMLRPGMRYYKRGEV